jgi:hypothetical protein
MRYVAFLGASTGMSHDAPTNFLSMWFTYGQPRIGLRVGSNAAKKKLLRRCSPPPLQFYLKEYHYNQQFNIFLLIYSHSTLTVAAEDKCPTRPDCHGSRTQLGYRYVWCIRYVWSRTSVKVLEPDGNIRPGRICLMQLRRKRNEGFENLSTLTFWSTVLLCPSW